jgi:hypothetical protein
LDESPVERLMLACSHWVSVHLSSYGFVWKDNAGVGWNHGVKPPLFSVNLAN